MIPKKIHYCWFGRKAKPKTMLNCIKSWREKCPDYEIIEWNEDNFDIHIVPYVEEAYAAKKWAFVADYVRLWIVYNHGGIYLDTDVEVVRSLDSLLFQECFFGFDDDKYVSTGLGFGSVKGNIIVSRMLHEYDSIHFLKPDGTYDLTPCPIRNTACIQDFLDSGVKKGDILHIKDAAIFPPEYFCPLSTDGVTLKVTEHTYSIHWFTASWLSEDQKIVHQYRIFQNRCCKHFGKKLGLYIARAIYLFFPYRRSVLKRM